MITVLLPADAAPDPGDRIALDDDERHHLRVRRVADAERLRWTNGAGRRGEALWRGDGVQIVSSDLVPAPAALRLLVGAGDKDRWGWLAEKAAELGVTDLVPVETERSRTVASRLREAHVERLQVRAREACKQCGAAWAPTVHPLVALADALAAVPADHARLLADAAGPSGAALPGPVAVLIGPEGGLTDDEIAAAREAGFAPVRLGPHILRFETAALAAAALHAVAPEA